MDETITHRKAVVVGDREVLSRLVILDDELSKRLHVPVKSELPHEVTPAADLLTGVLLADLRALAHLGP